MGVAGKKIEEQMKEIADKYGVRLLGPNCSGIINTHCSMVQSIGIVDALSKGNIGLISQAGVCAAGMLWGLRHIMDFGIIATIGNKLDINETDILEAVSTDENINVICMYLESVKGWQAVRRCGQAHHPGEADHRPEVRPDRGRKEGSCLSYRFACRQR